jgi:hypothetical protein
MIFYNLFCASFDGLSCVSAMGGMPDERYLPSCLRTFFVTADGLTGWERKIIKQKSRKIIRRFTATGITNFLENGGTLEVVQRIASHADSRTTELYDRRGQRVLLEDMERIRY